MKKILIAITLLGLSFSNLSHADTLEGALTELSNISSTMSPAEIKEKIDRFIARAPKGTDIANILTSKGLSNYIPTTGNSGTCTGNPHNCNSGSGITASDLKTSQDEQDKKQLAKDQSQDAVIDTKADKTDLNKETAERKVADAVLGGAIIGESIVRAAGDAALNNKINQNAENQSVKDKAQDAAINGKVDKTQYDKDKATQASTDKAQNTAIGNAQASANNAQNTANAALGVGLANTIGLGIEASVRANEDAKLQNQITSNKTN